MHIHTYGSSSDPIVIFLHPIGVTGSQFYELIHPHFKDDYYIIAPDQGGHGDDPGDYISPANDGKTLLRYLKERGLVNIRLLFGASLGAAAALRLLEDPGLSFDRVHLDGTPLIGRSIAKQSLVTSILQKELKSHHKHPDKVDPEKEEFEKQYGVCCKIKMVLPHFLVYSKSV